jgi:acetyl esterase/lipase
MKQLISIILLLSMTLSVSHSQNKNIVYLWPGRVPGETREKQSPITEPSRNDNVLRYNEVTNPAAEVFLPNSKTSNGGAVIICPGGGYRILAYDKEGTEIAAWLNKLGFAAFVLQYRVPDKREGALQDAQRIIRIVKKNADKWKIDPRKIGIMGFSAGGSLSARTSSQYNKKTYEPVDEADSLSCRPSFALLIYPAYLDQGPGNTITPEFQLDNGTPPLFIFQTEDDPYGNSALVMASALRKAKIPFELHLLPEGGHGYGLRAGNPAAETWPTLAEKWLIKILKTS